MEFVGVRLTKEMLLEMGEVSVKKGMINALTPEIDASCTALKNVMEQVLEVSMRYEAAYEGESSRVYRKAQESLQKKQNQLRNQMILLSDTLNTYNQDTVVVNQNADIMAGGSNNGKL